MRRRSLYAGAFGVFPRIPERLLEADDENH